MPLVLDYVLLAREFNAYLLVQPFQPTPAPLTTSLAGWMPNPSVSHPAVSAGPIGLGAPNSAGNFFHN